MSCKLLRKSFPKPVTAPGHTSVHPSVHPLSARIYEHGLAQVDAPWGTAWHAGKVMAMDLAVLHALEWRMGAVTAPDFLECLLLVANVGRDATGHLMDSKATHAARNTANLIIVTALQGTLLLELEFPSHFPSHLPSTWLLLKCCASLGAAT